MHDTTGLPVVLWQLPVGHINESQLPDACNGAKFPLLTNDNRQLEDSAPTYFLGDTFKASGARYACFGANQATDPKVTVNGSDFTWGRHMNEAACRGRTIGAVRHRGGREYNQHRRSSDGHLLVDQRGAGLLLSGGAVAVTSIRS